MIDVNTSIGKPYVTENNETIIPVSKITLGVLAGGGEYGEMEKKNNDENLAGGLGTCASLNPIGFLVITDCEIKFIKTSCDSVPDKFLDIAFSALEKLNNKAKTKCEN